jgi:hypothetical protein
MIVSMSIRRPRYAALPMAIMGVAGCAVAPYQPPTQGPTATLLVPPRPTVYAFSNASCASRTLVQTGANPSTIRPGAPPNRVTIAAGVTAHLAFGIDATTSSAGLGSCEVKLALDPQPGFTYTVTFQGSPTSGCRVEVRAEDASGNDLGLDVTTRPTAACPLMF